MPAKVSQAVIKRVLTQFEYHQNDISIKPTQSGYRNSIIPIEIHGDKPEKLALIFYKREPKILEKIKLTNLISNQLANNGWPTRQTISTNNQEILKLHTRDKTIFCCLYNYLDGSTIEWESYSKKHIKLLGQVLGYLHQDLERISHNINIIASKECSNLQQKLTKMNNYFTNIETQTAIEQKLKLRINPVYLSRYAKLLKWLNAHKKSQLLHLDFVRGNILFKNITNCHFDDKFVLKLEQKTVTNKSLAVTGVLDFEKAALGPRELDISRTLAFLLVDCKNKNPQKIVKYFIDSGYVKRVNIAQPNHLLITELVFMYLLIDLYQFFKHNPYEYLYQNQHFLRTRDYLIKYGNQRLLLPI